jgi:hypothetical protein
MKFYFSIFIFFIPILVLSQTKIEIIDTTINRAIINQIPVYGYLDKLEDGQLEICIEFNSLVLDIKNAKTDNNTIFSDINDFKIELNNYFNSLITIKSNNYKKNTFGILFYLDVEGLAGGDTLSMLKINCLKLNGNDIIISILKEGKIIVNSSIVNPKIIEGISQNRPNPFSEETSAIISIANNTNINIKVFSLDGKKVLNKDNSEYGLEIFIYDFNNNLIKDYQNHIFQKGEYKLVIKNNYSNISSGAYYLVMTTNSNIYKLNLLLVK